MNNKPKPPLDPSQLGFKTAFKATLGFYAGQFVASIIGLAILGLIGLLIVLPLIYYFNHN